MSRSTMHRATRLRTGPEARGDGKRAMEREIIRVEPFDSNFEKWGAPVSACTRAGQMVFVSGMPPFDPETGGIAAHAPFERAGRANPRADEGGARRGRLRPRPCAQVQRALHLGRALQSLRRNLQA